MVDISVDYCKIKSCGHQYGLVANLQDIHNHIHDKHKVTIATDKPDVLNVLVGRVIVTLSTLKGSIENTRVIK